MTDSSTDALPDELHNSAQWLRHVFPDGIPEQQYHALLAVLAPEFSDRQLARLIAHLTGRDHAYVLNDVYRVQATPPAELDLEPVRRHLNACGFPDALDADGSHSR
ncbi:DUF3349 domain-containing protein [Deinococcus multiflagellatus]|uniref:DUF3349 domain-containing protein n=1 Tax=Deinococcus multiflagellatus TaxID=1656887 RepID=A0ABW1ZLZ9_9DEIO|nr:DUF3349 domain-containing protein [Deinococcus multiflagellatus]